MTAIGITTDGILAGLLRRDIVNMIERRKKLGVKHHMVHVNNYASEKRTFPDVVPSDGSCPLRSERSLSNESVS